MQTQTLPLMTPEKLYQLCTQATLKQVEEKNVNRIASYAKRIPQTQQSLFVRGIVLSRTQLEDRIRGMIASSDKTELFGTQEDMLGLVSTSTEEHNISPFYNIPYQDPEFEAKLKRRESIVGLVYSLRPTIVEIYLAQRLEKN